MRHRRFDLRFMAPDRARQLALPAIVLGALGLAAVPARAQEEAAAPARAGGGFHVASGPFGEMGQWVYSISSEGEFPFSFSKHGGDPWSFTFRPSGDVFVRENLSAGGIVVLHHDGGGSVIGLGPRVGYNVALGSLVSIWLRGAFYYQHETVNNGPDHSDINLDIRIPFLFHFVPHFLIGVGPFFTQPIYDSTPGASKTATYGLSAIVGGYF